MSAKRSAPSPDGEENKSRRQSTSADEEGEREEEEKARDGGTPDSSEFAHFDEEETDRRRQERKRAYNRLNAARARKRTKEQIASLEARVQSLEGEVVRVQQLNDRLVRGATALQEENRVLRGLLGASSDQRSGSSSLRYTDSGNSQLGGGLISLGTQAAAHQLLVSGSGTGYTGTGGYSASLLSSLAGDRARAGASGPMSSAVSQDSLMGGAAAPPATDHSVIRQLLEQRRRQQHPQLASLDTSTSTAASALSTSSSSRLPQTDRGYGRPPPLTRQPYGIADPAAATSPAESLLATSRGAAGGPRHGAAAAATTATDAAAEGRAKGRREGTGTIESEADRSKK